MLHPAIHAKRQTVMNKDIHCLRDLWYSIDPTSPIGSSEGHQRIVWENKRKFDKKLVAQCENAALKIHHLKTIGHEIPKKLEHFMRGIDVDSLVRKAETGVVSRPPRK
jgi:hypothetical protein